MRLTTVGELGNKLPIGQPQADGTLDKSFVLRPYKSRVDRQLGLWEKANATKYGADAGQLLSCKVAKYISLICDAYGPRALPHEENGDSTAESELAVHAWPFADVMYVYVYSRVASLGKMMTAPCACHLCNWSGEVEFDLTTCDVRVAESLADMGQWVDLKKPFKLRDERTMLKSIKVAPVQWATMAKPGVMSSSVQEVSYYSLLDAICAVNGDETVYQMTEDELDEMERLDRIRVNKLADEVAAGLDLRTKITCPNKKCGAPIVNPLNWSFDHFFGESVPLGT